MRETPGARSFGMCRHATESELRIDTYPRRHAAWFTLLVVLWPSGAGCAELAGDLSTEQVDVSTLDAGRDAGPGSGRDSGLDAGDATGPNGLDASGPADAASDGATGTALGMADAGACVPGDDCMQGSCVDGCGPEGCCTPDGGTCCDSDDDCADGFACERDRCGCASSCPADGDRSVCARGRVCRGGRCELLLEMGEPCALSFECASGHCFDGVCCDRACDAPCFSCGSAGLCAPDSAGSPCGEPPSGPCDRPDLCDGQGTCEDVVAGLGEICRPEQATAPECDVAEICDGVDKACPADLKAPQGTPCGDRSAADCDAPDSCDGDGACVDRIDSAGTLCRPPSSDQPECDAPERCTGEGKACPPDGARPDGTECAGDPGICCGGQCATGGFAGADLDAACRSDGARCLGAGTYGHAPAHEGESCEAPRCVCSSCGWAGVCAQSAPGTTACTQRRCQAGTCSDAEVVAGAACTCARVRDGMQCGTECSGDVERVCFDICCSDGSCAAFCGLDDL